MEIQIIDQKQALHQALEDSTSILLLKHSLTCPISAEAKRTFELYAKETETQMYVLPIQQARELSTYIAEQFHIKHESPQVLLFENGDVRWNASHYSITVQSLRDAEQQKS
ncbi:bacillithiol system redox-active protein YtxJ [Pontibacillus litoralis]|uniref:Bacillithiol system protein YtxJ n=1 Tax=Pontibacillus litoralis JSM 072002 TaxID=1385512 RepID=A0A0A5GD66_9BACI|nr:bacillithiol system redox-active protein YtxJ [Pontibacillus litoralis]KGX89148.1 hypothetical protein N784_02140 [Pontibacillus litoralis JSM 072002]